MTQLQRPSDKPITWLIPHNGTAPDWVVGEHDTLAVRVTAPPGSEHLSIIWWSDCIHLGQPSGLARGS